MDTPDNSASTRVPRGGPVLLLWIPVLVFIVYPLSLGPAVLLARKQPATEPALSVVYAPLGALIDHCPPVQKFLDAYVHLWVPTR
jgi:hypothetical protein